MTGTVAAWSVSSCFEVKLQQFVRRDERADFGVEHFLLELRDAGFDLRVVVEAVLQHLVDGFVHPILVLTVAVVREVSVRLNEVEELFDAFPHLLESRFVYAEQV